MGTGSGGLDLLGVHHRLRAEHKLERARRRRQQRNLYFKYMAVSFLASLLAILCAFWIKTWYPETEVDMKYRRPAPQPTSHYAAPVPPRVDPVSRIIEQNYNCWLAVPGATCGPERTYI